MGGAVTDPPCQLQTGQHRGQAWEWVWIHKRHLIEGAPEERQPLVLTTGWRSGHRGAASCLLLGCGATEFLHNPKQKQDAGEGEYNPGLTNTNVVSTTELYF